MERLTLTPADREAWLDLRMQDITSTDCAALFGCSPYATPFDLFHRKAGNLEDDFEANERMKWGTRLEPVIAAGVAEDYGLIVEPYKGYRRIAGKRMGSSFDFKVVGLYEGAYRGDECFRDLFRQLGPGLMEIKNVDGLQFRRGWLTGDEREAPPHIEFQVQHQMEVDDTNWTIITPLVGGNTPVPFARLRDRDIGDLIYEKVAEFWSNFDAGIEPVPDLNMDAATVIRMYQTANEDQLLDLSQDAAFAALCAEYDSLGIMKTDAEKKRDALKAQIFMRLGDAGAALASGFKINAKMTKDSEGTYITADMVGTHVGDRAGYRQLRLTRIKAK